MVDGGWWREAACSQQRSKARQAARTPCLGDSGEAAAQIGVVAAFGAADRRLRMHASSRGWVSWTCLWVEIGEAERANVTMEVEMEIGAIDGAAVALCSFGSTRM
jgi:hypothetical protein